jgi:hypothetical protein
LRLAQPESVASTRSDGVAITDSILFPARLCR